MRREGSASRQTAAIPEVAAAVVVVAPAAVVVAALAAVGACLFFFFVVSLLLRPTARCLSWYLSEKKSALCVHVRPALNNQFKGDCLLFAPWSFFALRAPSLLLTLPLSASVVLGLFRRRRKVGLATMLCEQHQAHLMDGWPMPGTDDDKKHAFFKQARLAKRNAVPISCVHAV